MRLIKKRFRLSSFRIISLSFFLLILTGGIILTLPISSIGRHWTNFLDALFTATSASCVTGLIVHDTATYWSVFGQAVILMLIQIGGMGVVTIAIFITVHSGRKIGLMQRSTMQDAISAPQVGGIVRLTEFIIKMTAIIELAGAAAMAPVFIRDFGVGKGIWYSIFHSVSAFCNAGFDLMGVRGQFSSLTTYSAQPVINITIMLLIIIGGIGFFTWNDIKTNKFRFRKFRMQSKVILVTTAALIFFGAAYFFFFEFLGSDRPGNSLGEKILMSFFQSVTPRTAGFNTMDLTKLHESGQGITIILMLIGGSPGSTAGGMKTTTVAVLIIYSLSVFRQREHANCFGRRIPTDAIKFASTILLMYLTLFLCGGMVISYIENIPLITALFETASAIGTVGLTMGITSKLCAVSKIILIMLMFCGRVGGLTLVYAASSSSHPNVSEYPREQITIG